MIAPAPYVANAPAVRAATIEDYPAIVTLVRSTRLFGFVNRTVIRQSIEKSELNIVDHKQIIAGFIRYHRRKDNKHTIYDLYVVPQYRRRGYATALFDSIPTPKQLRCPNYLPYAAAHAFYTRLAPTHHIAAYDMTLYVWDTPT